MRWGWPRGGCRRGSRWPRSSRNSGRWPPEKPEESPLWGIVAKLPAIGPRPNATIHRARPTSDRRQRSSRRLRQARGFRGVGVSSRLPRQRRPLGLARRGRALRLPRPLVHDDRPHPRADPRDRPRRDGQDPRGDGGDPQKVGFRGRLERFFRAPPGRPEVQELERGGDPRSLPAIFVADRRQAARLFGRLPRTDYGSAPIEPYRAKAAAAGYYYPAPEDGSRPGYFYVNTSEPTSRTTYRCRPSPITRGCRAITSSSAWRWRRPAAPRSVGSAMSRPSRKGGGSTARACPARSASTPTLTPNWAGSNTTPGAAGRLVVDTGLHHKGWSRDQAIAYLEANTAVPRIEIESEVDRYIAWPGQALRLQDRRTEDPRDPHRPKQRHGQVRPARVPRPAPVAGSVPLSVLERYMRQESLAASALSSPH